MKFFKSILLISIILSSCQDTEEKVTQINCESNFSTSDVLLDINEEPSLSGDKSPLARYGSYEGRRRCLSLPDSTLQQRCSITNLDSFLPVQL